MTDTQQQIKNSRLILLSIVGIPVTVVLAATWLWYFVARGDIDLVSVLGTSNNGSLVQPARLLDEGQLQVGDRAFHYNELEPRWTLLVPGGSRCGESCEEVLYLTRQIHLAMGKELARIQRFYVSDTAVADTHFGVTTLSDKHPAPLHFEQYLEDEQRGLKHYTMPSRHIAELFPEYLADPGTWYLVDPAGWIMMSYHSEVSYKDVMADLKFLLKNSSE